MDIFYQIRRSARKTIAIHITPRGEVEVRCPARMPKREIDAFVRSRSGWIQAHLPKDLPEPLSPGELRALAGQAARWFPARAAHFAPLVGVTYGRVTIRSQKSRWGSCSAKGNLNFNCLLMLAPEAVRDYVVVHELCHRLHMDHSSRFWAEVGRVMPDYAERRAWLRQHGAALLARLPMGKIAENPEEKC